MCTKKISTEIGGDMNDTAWVRNVSLLPERTRRGTESGKPQRCTRARGASGVGGSELALAVALRPATAAMMAMVLIIIEYLSFLLLMQVKTCAKIVRF